MKTIVESILHNRFIEGLSSVVDDKNNDAAELKKDNLKNTSHEPVTDTNLKHKAEVKLG